jgi:hypothetical protein
VDKPALTIFTPAVVAEGHLVDLDGLPNTQGHHRSRLIDRSGRTVALKVALSTAPYALKSVQTENAVAIG